MSAQFLKFEVSKFVTVSDEVQKAQWFGRQQQIEDGKKPTIYVQHNRFVHVGTVNATSGPHALEMAKKRYPEIPAGLLAVQDETWTWQPFEFSEAAAELVP